jgi:pimeloyl-ACP methyl ester carboxylesterase/ketosteroid isomerase-like protein
MFANASFSAASAVFIAAALVVEVFATQQPSMGPAPGRLIDVGGYKLHIHCIGEGAPTVVIDGGAGAWSIHYTHIQKALPGARVCTYDRAGLGWSDTGPAPRTSERMVEELHTLLHGAGVAPPLVLAGHSLGGYNVRIYQARYPEEVGALVLLDAAHEQQWDRLPPQARQLTQASVAGLRKRGEQARNGQLRAEEITPAGVFVTRSPELRDTYVAAMLTGKPYEGQAAETEASFESARQVPVGHRLGNLPLVVLTARRSFDAFKGSGIPLEESNTLWLAFQNELASLSRNSQHLFSDGHHRLHETDPDAVVSAIKLAVTAVKARPQPPAGLGLPSGALPLRSTRAVDRLLAQLETAYRSMDVEGFVSLFTDDVEQLDVNRRIHVKGKAAWTEQTRKINAAHRTMERRHRGRAVMGDWIVTEIEWAGTVRGEALGAPGRDFTYRYTGLGLQSIRDGKIHRQILYGDYATLAEQLATGTVATVRPDEKD